MAKIILTRKKDFLSWFNRYAVYIDGEHKGSIKWGASEEYEVAGGEHTVLCKESFYSSNTFYVRLDPQDVRFLRVKHNMPFTWLAFLLLLAMVTLPFVMPDYKEGLRYFRYGGLAVIFLYGLYNIIFARNRALLVQEDKTNIFAH